MYTYMDHLTSKCYFKWLFKCAHKLNELEKNNVKDQGRRAGRGAKHSCYAFASLLSSDTDTIRKVGEKMVISISYNLRFDHLFPHMHLTYLLED